MSMDITRMGLTLMNVDPFVYKNNRALVMPFQQKHIALHQIDALFMETFRQQIRFLDGTFYNRKNLYQQHLAATVIIVNVGSAKV